MLGAVLPLEKGPQDDEFFLTFDIRRRSLTTAPKIRCSLVITLRLRTCASSDIGVKTFDEIDATYAAITGISRTTYQRGGIFPVDETYQELRQSLPAVEDINTFLSSHQVAIAQLAIQYCDAAVEDATLWPGFDFDAAPGTAFSAGEPRQLCRTADHARCWSSTDQCPDRVAAELHDVYDELALVLIRLADASGQPDRPTAASAGHQ